MLDKERQFVNTLNSTFSKQFKVSNEVWSKDKTARIDIVLHLKDDIYFGIECKCPDKKRGEDIGEYIKQAIRYSNLEFEVSKGIYKKIPIFICPPLSYNYFIMKEETILHNGKEYHCDRHEALCSHNSVNGLLGAFGIGEVRKAWYGYYLSLSNKIIYSSQKDDGLRLKNYLLTLKKLSICQI